MPKRGEIKDRTGEIGYTRFGTLMKIVEYKDSHNIMVEFQDKYKVKVHTGYNNFKKGVVYNPYDKSVYSVGYIGEGKYNWKDNFEIYKEWKSMLSRCYDPYRLNKYPTYIDVTVCKEWHNFQNFCKWYEENYYEIGKGRMHLDKDILLKGCKIYSPETCMFVPERINYLLLKNDGLRGELPIGCGYFSNKTKIKVRCQILKEDGERKREHLGVFPSNRPFQAFTVYKNFKENYIKEVADEYYSKGLIPKKLYDALYKYEVEIND